jgi:hypothetical protein
MEEPPIRLRCANCKSPFNKLRREHRRLEARGQKLFYCTQSCAARMNNRLVPRGNLANLLKGKHDDELSPFRWFICRARYRTKKGPTDLTAAYLARLYIAQSGTCPLTGWRLVLPRNCGGWPDGLTPASASLDRIRNAEGYVQGNVRFVAVMANLARYTFSDSQLLDFCSAVHNHRK